MKTATVVTFGLVLGFAAIGCDNDPEPELATEQTPSIEALTVSQAATLLAAGRAVPVDANGTETREEFGVIPDARLLTSSSQYDVTEELPADHETELIFYCSNENCSASDGAAERAVSAGFKNVNVLRPGIRGWREAGHTTDQPTS